MNVLMCEWACFVVALHLRASSSRPRCCLFASYWREEIGTTAVVPISFFYAQTTLTTEIIINLATLMDENA